MSQAPPDYMVQSDDPRRIESKGFGRSKKPSIEIGKLFDRLPPNAVEAEMALLGSMMLNSDVTGEVIQIVKSQDDFYKPAHGAIFQALVDLYDQHNAGDIAMLYQLLVDRQIAEDIGGPEYLEQLANQTPVAVNAVHYANTVSEKATLRRLIGAAGSILESAYAKGEDVREVLDTAEKVIFEVVEHIDGPNTAEPLVTLLEKTMERIEAHDGRLVTGLETAYREFDEWTAGLQAGDMIILAARPSMGKTSLALNLSENIALLGHGVGLFSLEMNKQQLAQRLLGSRAEVDSQRLRRNTLRTEELQRLSMAVGELSEAPIYIDDTPGISVLELRARARRMVSRHDVKLIIVDYLQLMRGSSKESRQQEVSEISRGIKALARELNVPVLCLSQLNRAAENREDHRPRLADLRESGSIEQDADVVLMLHREDRYHESDPDWDPNNIAELIISKQRNGPTGTVKFTWVGASMKFKEYTSITPPGEVSGWSPNAGYSPPSSSSSGYSPPSGGQRDETPPIADDGIPI